MSIREEIFTRRVHGGISTDEIAHTDVDLREIIDFSASINPYGPCPAVVHAVRACPIDRYPDPTSAPLRRALAHAHATSAESIVVGNGAADLLWTLARVLLSPGDTVVISEPTFAEFRAGSESAGARVVACRARAESGFAPDLDALQAAIANEEARVLYIASPNTPVGTRVPVESIVMIAAKNPGLTVVLDQAFVSLSDHPGDERVPVPENVVRVRSLTKDHAIAGLRLGYLLAASDLAARIEKHRPPWTTNSVAEAAGLTAVRAPLFVEESRQLLRADRDELVQSLRDLGLAPFATTSCFVCFAVPDGASLRQRLLAKGMLVRECTSFGMPNYVRVGARPRVDRERLIAALKEELSH